MTLIVGLKCREAVIIGAEEEESAGIAAKRRVAKIALIKSKEWVVAVAAAGETAIAENAMRRITKLLEGKDTLNGEELGEAVDEVLSVVYEKYIDPDPKPEGVQFVIGASCSDGLHLMCTQGRTTQFVNDMAVAGYGSDPAIFFLDRLYEYDTDWVSAMKTLGFSLFQAKETSQYCGGESVIKVLQQPPFPRWRDMGSEVCMELDNESRNCGFPEFIREHLSDRGVYAPGMSMDYSDENISIEENNKRSEEWLKNLSNRSSQDQP